MAFRSAYDDEYDGPLDPDLERGLALGAAFGWLLDEYPEHPFTKDVLRFLDVALVEPEERALFNLSPRLDYDDKLVPLRPPLEEM